MKKSCSSLLIVLLIHNFFQTCAANCSTPSACGSILDIKFPFRLKDDCGHRHRELELVCENNVTAVHLNSHKYYVKAINYGDFGNSSIRVVDASINNIDIFCSFPNYSVHVSSFSHHHQLENLLIPSVDAVSPIKFTSCPNPLKNPSLFTEITGCAYHGRYAYIKVGHMNTSEVQQTCRVDLLVMASWKFKDLKNVSLSEIHDACEIDQRVRVLTVS